MQEIYSQLKNIWKEIKPFQKGGFLLMVALVVTILGFFAFGPERSSKMSQTLEESKSDPFAASTTKTEGGKGFELFDTNTWIKGEKELQILEMRALKGQLEKDLQSFESIKSAIVILDMAPPKSFNGPQYKTKASVILTLMPSKRLTASELHAVTYHLVGAVRGLDPQMIAISDSSGKLYKSLDPEECPEKISARDLLFEEHIEEKMEKMFTELVGKGHFFTTVQASNRPTCVLMAVIDSHLFKPEVQETAKQEFERALHSLVEGYDRESKVLVHFSPFEAEPEKKENPRIIKGSLWNSKFLIGALSSLICGGFFLALFFFTRPKKVSETKEFSLGDTTLINLEKLASSIEKEDPETIAFMISYLEPARAEKLLTAFPEELQEKILIYLSNMEQET